MTLRIVTEGEMPSLKTGTIIKILQTKEHLSMTRVKIFGNKTTELWLPSVAIIWFTEELKEGV